MDNGLRGRYLPQLEAWNNAQRFASEIVEAYFNESLSLQQALDEWNLSEQNVATPDFQTIKQMVSNTLFLDGYSTINELAVQIKRWDGWRDVETPEVFQSIEGVEQRSASGVSA